jgi:serpin B
MAIALPFADTAAETPTIVSRNFSASLHKQIRGENLVYSPYSIASAFLMAHLGAKGETESQLKKLFNYPEDPITEYSAIERALSSGPVIRIANSLFFQNGFHFNESYLDSLRQLGSELREVDFSRDEARVTINEYVSQSTEGKIPELFLTKFDPITKAIIVNAIYFKGRWSQEFDGSKTRDLPFQVSPTQSRKVPFFGDRREVLYTEQKDYKAIALPYQGERLFFSVILPNSKLEEFSDRLDGAFLDSLFKSFTVANVAINLPRFKIRNRISLVETLSKLGIPNLFSEELADLSGIEPKRLLYVTDAVHEAVIEVAEKGTEAAAATGIAMGERSARPPEKQFIADRPFIFLISDWQTKTILFAGELHDPV